VRQRTGLGAAEVASSAAPSFYSVQLKPSEREELLEGFFCAPEKRIARKLGMFFSFVAENKC